MSIQTEDPQKSETKFKWLVGLIIAFIMLAVFLNFLPIFGKKEREREPEEPINYYIPRERDIPEPANAGQVVTETPTTLNEIYTVLNVKLRTSEGKQLVIVGAIILLNLAAMAYLLFAAQEEEADAEEGKPGFNLNKGRAKGFNNTYFCISAGVVVVLLIVFVGIAVSSNSGSGGSSPTKHPDPNLDDPQVFQTGHSDYRRDYDNSYDKDVCY